MTDWSDAEYQKLHGFRGGIREEMRRWNLQPYLPQGNAPEALDWREKGLVTEIKTQGTCGLC